MKRERQLVTVCLYAIVIRASFFGEESWGNMREQLKNLKQSSKGCKHPSRWGRKKSRDLFNSSGQDTGLKTEERDIAFLSKTQIMTQMSQWSGNGLLEMQVIELCQVFWFLVAWKVDDEKGKCTRWWKLVKFFSLRSLASGSQAVKDISSTQSRSQRDHVYRLSFSLVIEHSGESILDDTTNIKQSNQINFNRLIPSLSPLSNDQKRKMSLHYSLSVIKVIILGAATAPWLLLSGNSLPTQQKVSLGYQDGICL